MLIVLHNLSGTGKTTITQIIARKCLVTYLCIDTIEETNLSLSRTQKELGAMSFVAAHEIAGANLCPSRWIRRTDTKVQ